MRTQLTCWKCGNTYYKEGSNDSPRHDLCMKCYYPICTLLESKHGYAHVKWDDKKWEMEAKRLLGEGEDEPDEPLLNIWGMPDED